jgi:hypothetical protein
MTRESPIGAAGGKSRKWEYATGLPDQVRQQQLRRTGRVAIMTVA